MRRDPASATRDRMRASAGFTLIEMLVVLAIVGSLAGGTAVALRPMRDRHLLARSSAALLELVTRARSIAIREGRPVLLRFDPARREATIEGTRTRATLDSTVTLQLTTAREVSTGEDQAILFLPDGTGSGGTLRLETAGGTLSRSLRISWLTGVVDAR